MPSINDRSPIRAFYAPGSYSGTPPINPAYRLSPCPKFNFETRYKYANDNIIGYDYVVTLTGYATAIDKIFSDAGVQNYGLLDVAQKIETVRAIFSVNGGILIITDETDQPLIVAKGGIVRSITFDQSNNFWVNYTPYTVEIVFNEIDFTGCAYAAPATNDTFGCSGLYPHLFNNTNSVYSSSLINLSEYKIESYKDQWSLDLGDTIYNTYDEFKNEHFLLEYKIEAVGQTYFNGNKVLPAWENAKNFCQEKTYNFVKALIKGILNKSNTAACTASKNLPDLHTVGTSTSDNGIISLSTSADNYEVFNETITCDTSQTAGSFSLIYRSIVKKLNSSSQFAPTSAIHIFSINKTTTNDNANKSVNISIQGNIQGLIPGGLIRNENVLRLPDTGSILIHNNPTENTNTKYTYALEAYNKISNGSDLKDDFKDKLNIRNSELGVSCNPNDNPRCASHSVNHSYADGIITYTTEFNNKIACIGNSSIRNVVMEQSDPTPRIAEFVVPGRSLGPIIQRLGSDEPRTISIKIEGVNPNLRCCFSPDAIINDISLGIHKYLPNDIPPEQIPNLVLTQNTYNTNPLDGSFAIQRTYICCDANVLL